MASLRSLDVRGQRRSPATTSEFHVNRAPANKGRRYPADPPRVEEIVAVMRHAGEGAHGERLRALIVVMRRAGLRITVEMAREGVPLNVIQRQLGPANLRITSVCLQGIEATRSSTPSMRGGRR